MATKITDIVSMLESLKSKPEVKKTSDFYKLQNSGLVDYSGKPNEVGDAFLNEYNTLSKKYGKENLILGIKNMPGNFTFAYEIKIKPNAKEKSEGKAKSNSRPEISLQKTAQTSSSTEIKKESDKKTTQTVTLPIETKTSETNIKDYLQGIKENFPVIDSISESGNSFVLKTRITHSRDSAKFKQIESELGLSLTGGESKIEENNDRGQIVDSRNYTIKGSNLYDKITLSSERVAKRKVGNPASAFKEQPLKIIISPNYNNKEEVEKLLKSLSKNFKYKERKENV